MMKQWHPLSERAEAYLKVLAIEGALRIGPLDEAYAGLRRELVQEQRRLAELAMPEVLAREETLG